MSNGYLKENYNFPRFQRGSNIFQGGGGGSKCLFLSKPSIPPLNTCMIYKLVFAPIEDLDQTASLRVLYIKARVQSFFKVKTKTDQTLGCADGFEYLLCAHDNLYPAHSYTYYGLLC